MSTIVWVVTATFAVGFGIEISKRISLEAKYRKLARDYAALMAIHEQTNASFERLMKINQIMSNLICKLRSERNILWLYKEMNND